MCSLQKCVYVYHGQNYNVYVFNLKYAASQTPHMCRLHKNVCHACIYMVDEENGLVVVDIHVWWMKIHEENGLVILAWRS